MTIFAPSKVTLIFYVSTSKKGTNVISILCEQSRKQRFDQIVSVHTQDFIVISDRPNFRFGRTSAKLSVKGKVQKFQTKEGVRRTENRPIFGQFLAKFG